MSEAVGEVHGHDVHDAPHPNYMAVFYGLFAITVAEVGIVYVAMPQWLLIAILLLMALVKAAMVAMYFMHLKYDNKMLSVIAVTPLVLIAIAVAVVAYEYASYEPTSVSSRSNALPLVAPE